MAGPGRCEAPGTKCEQKCSNLLIPRTESFLHFQKAMEGTASLI